MHFAIFTSILYMYFFYSFFLQQIPNVVLNLGGRIMEEYPMHMFHAFLDLLLFHNAG